MDMEKKKQQAAEEEEAANPMKVHLSLLCCALYL